MISLRILQIGFGVILFGVRLMMIRNSIHRAGEVKVDNVRRIKNEGILLSIVGAIVLIIGYSGWISGEAAIVVVNGGAVPLIILGFSQLIQWIVFSGRGSERHVYLGARVTTGLGAALLVIAYPIIVLIFKL